MDEPICSMCNTEFKSNLLDQRVSKFGLNLISKASLESVTRVSLLTIQVQESVVPKSSLPKDAKSNISLLESTNQFLILIRQEPLKPKSFNKLPIESNFNTTKLR